MLRCANEARCHLGLRGKALTLRELAYKLFKEKVLEYAIYGSIFTFQ
jgi:hypothetical protein